MDYDLEPNLFLRKGEYSENEADVWDDSQLVKAYDKAISKAKRQIMKKLKNEMGLTEEDVQGIISDSSSSSCIRNKRKTNKKKKQPKDEISWKVGDACRAVFSEDGEEYEANIISMTKQNCCVVKFVGYNNEEKVLLKDLTPSLGKNVVKLQMEMAENCPEQELEGQSESEVEEGEIFSSDTPVKNEFSPKRRSNDIPLDYKEFHPQFPSPALYHNAPFPPPPPPPLPSFSGMNPMAGISPTDLSSNDSLNSLLLSWYLCGYQTGYYTREANEQKHKPNGKF